MIPNSFALRFSTSRDRNSSNTVLQMASEVRLSTVDSDLKDVIQNIFEIQSAIHGYLGSETQQELIRKLNSLTLSLKTLSDHTSIDQSIIDAAFNKPRTAIAVSDADPLLHTVQLPPEIIDYVDGARNPDIYTREFVELVQKGNQDLKGKAEAFSSFRDTLAREMASGMPECKKEVVRIVKATGGDAQNI